MGGQMVIKDDEWDELAINKNRRRSKKKKFKNLEHQKDAEFSHFEEKRFIETLENSSGKYSWMKELLRLRAPLSMTAASLFKQTTK